MNNYDIAVLHFIINPGGGAWNVIKNLITCQKNYFNVGLCISYKKDLPEYVLKDVLSLEVEKFFFKIPIDFPYSSGIFIPPIQRWIDIFYKKYSPKSIIIHLHNGAASGLLFWPINRLNKYSYIRVINTFHGVPPEYNYPELGNSNLKIEILVHRFLINKMFNSNVRFVALGNENRFDLSRIYDLPLEEIEIIHNGVNRISSQYKVDSNEFRIGFIGSLDQNKGWEIALEVIEMLHRDNNNCKLILVGAGPDANKLRKIIENKSSYIDYLGYIPNAGENIFSNIDVLIMPSKQEGQPLVMLEAMAGGVPVVGTSVGAIKETIVSGETGFLIGNRNSQEFYYAIKKIMTDNNLYKKMSRNSFKEWEEKYTTSIMCNNYLRIYEKLYEPKY